MDLYPNASMNAQDSAMYPPLSPQYQAGEIEFFIGDSSNDSVCHFKNGKLIDFNLNNAGDKPVYQVLIDNAWAYIEADGQVLLDRLNGFVLPQISQQEQQQVVQSMAKVSGVEL